MEHRIAMLREPLERDTSAKVLALRDEGQRRGW